jgi:hypothetical protein
MVIQCRLPSPLGGLVAAADPVRLRVSPPRPRSAYHRPSEWSDRRRSDPGAGADTMRPTTLAIVLVAALGASPADPISEAIRPTAKITLFNHQNLGGWSTSLHDHHADDPLHVFSVCDGLLRISGEEWGGIAIQLVTNASRSALTSCSSTCPEPNGHGDQRRSTSTIALAKASGAS